MMRAFFAAIGGLRNHITYMDVVGNNIANVNTTGFKSSRVTFQDMLSQTLTGASAPTAERGGTNAAQVGLGMTLRSIDVLHLQGSLRATGKLTDFAIQGKGFFIVKDGARTFYTRDGAFELAVSGELVNPSNGFKVQGWVADSSGAVDTTKPVGSITIPFGQSVSAQATTKATSVGNLDSRVAATGTGITSIDVYDSLGNTHAVQITYTKGVANTWGVSATSTSTEVSGITFDAASLIFNSSGVLQTPDPTTTPPTPLKMTTTFNAGVQQSSPIVTDIDVTGMTQFAADSNVSTSFNNGFSAGSLVSFSVGPAGDITGIFSTGAARPVGQLAMALFTNAAGLQRAGANNFELTSNSGVANVGMPGTSGRGSVGTGVVEGSNTDLAREFTNMILAQRGFQAASRVISTSDEMLEDLVNLIR